jgi:hypothetical protein
LAGDTLDVNQLVGFDLTRLLQLLDHLQNQFWIVFGHLDDDG